MDESKGMGAPIEKKDEVIKPKDTPYGPWMVVSYGRNGKSGVKGNTGGKGSLNTIDKPGNYIQIKGTKVGEPQLVSIDNIVKEVGESSRPASIGSVKARDTGMAPKKSRNSNIAEENNILNRLVTTSGVKARGTGVVPEKSKNNKIAEKNNNLNRAAVGKGFRFAVLADSVDEKSVPHVEHKSKDKSPMVTTEDDDAKGPSIFKNTSNMGPSPCKEVAGIKSG
ncbi:hypothetical protein ACOSQ3_027623 [Xanthoceras sorbifolium]